MKLHCARCKHIPIRLTLPFEQLSSSTSAYNPPSSTSHGVVFLNSNVFRFCNFTSIWFGGLKILNSIWHDLIISSIQRNSIISSIRFALDCCSPSFVSPSVFAAEGNLIVLLSCFLSLFLLLWLFMFEKWLN
jgi:hypothetical protein